MRGLSDRIGALVFLGLSCTFGVGCGGSDTFEYVAIRGKVTCNGNPVESGLIQFAPMAKPSSQIAKEGGGLGDAGKPANASIQADGTYVLTTSTSDGVQQGAVVGKHRVSIQPASKDIKEVFGIEDGGSLEDELKAQELEEEAEERGFQNPLLIPLPCREVTALEVELSAADNVLNIEMSEGGKITKVTEEAE